MPLFLCDLLASHQRSGRGLVSGQTDPYVRVYYSIINDEKFEEIYPDDAALAAWLRLLLVADALYPASAPIPQGTRKKSLLALVDCGLVELVGFGQFRIVGLAAERARRSAPGHKGADGRWHRNADALPPDSGGNAADDMPAMPDTPRRAAPRHDDSPQPPVGGGLKKRPRRADGDTLRSNGKSPRQLREGSPEVDARALADVARRAAAWNETHPDDQIATPKPADDWIAGGSDA